MTPTGRTPPEVSIIVTFHNNVEHVAAAVGMIDAQTFERTELILVDDGSTDGTTAALAGAAAARSTAQLLDISPNGGVAAARNRAIERARGEYIWFVDCDDLWEPTILETLVATARETGSELVCCRAVRASSPTQREERPLDGMPHRVTVDHDGAIRALIRRELRGYLWNKLIRRDVVGTAPFPSVRLHSDFGGVIEMVSRTRSATFLPDVLYTHLVRPGSITNGSDPDLGSIEFCWRRARQLALDSGVYTAGDRELEFFDYVEYYLAAVDAFYRSSSDSEASRNQLREIRRTMTLGGILRVLRRDRTVGVAALAFKLTGGAFGQVYRVYRRLSRRAVLHR